MASSKTQELAGTHLVLDCLSALEKRALASYCLSDIKRYTRSHCEDEGGGVKGSTTVVRLLRAYVMITPDLGRRY